MTTRVRRHGTSLGPRFPFTAATVRRDATPDRRASGRGWCALPGCNGRTPLSRWASDRDHYTRKPLVWYVSPSWRAASGL